MGAEIQHYQDPEQIDLRAVLDTPVEQLADWLATAAKRRRHAARSRRPEEATRDGQLQPQRGAGAAPPDAGELRARGRSARSCARPTRRTPCRPSSSPKGWELGLVQESIPEAFGGFGGTRSAVSGALVLEELAYGGLALALAPAGAAAGHRARCWCSGTDAQRAQWLPRFAGADVRGRHRGR